MSLLTIAELLAGEAVVTPGGAVDRVTASGEDERLWMGPVAQAADDEASAPPAAVTVEQGELVLAPA